ncbi:MAG: YdcF family protein [Atopobiaceae bacterium]|nr:YdcF family protein [Atopobiaceae bacterium]
MASSQTIKKPTERIWRRFLILVLLSIALLIVSYSYIKPRLGSYEAVGIHVFNKASFDAGSVTVDDPSVVEVTSVKQDRYGHVRVRFNALADGETAAQFTANGYSDYWSLKVRDGAVIEGGINFSGWRAIHASICVFFVVAAALFLSAFWKLWDVSWYGYTMVACGGGLLFTLIQFLSFSILLYYRLTPTLNALLTDVIYMADMFVSLAFLPMSLLAILISLSNISLIRHEGMRPINCLGVAASLLWFGAVYLWVNFGFIFNAFYNRTQWMHYVHTAFGVAIAFGVCLLFSTILCAWLASRHMPDKQVDYLIILRCGIRDDGTPCPLLAGRVDKAADFDERRIAAGDPPTTFVPSGGRGSDEPISEAESMANYLVEHRGVERGRIVPENRSTTTAENMLFSREVIDQHSGRDVADMHVGFCTTNYHVFRGYVYGHRAGMAVEGMGSRTKYYFWPNAFLREFVGLLATKWLAILQTFLAVASIYVFAEYVLSII